MVFVSLGQCSWTEQCGTVSLRLVSVGWRGLRQDSSKEVVGQVLINDPLEMSCIQLKRPGLYIPILDQPLNVAYPGKGMF